MVAVWFAAVVSAKVVLLVIEATVSLIGIPGALTTIPTTSLLVSAQVTVVLVAVVEQVVRTTVASAVKVCAEFVAVAFALRTNCVPFVMELTVELLGMPVPTTTMPATSPVVLAQVMPVLPLVVEQPVRLRLWPVKAIPAARPAVLVQVTFGLPLVSTQFARFTLPE